MSALTARLRRTNPQLVIFLTGIALMGVTSGVSDTTFNNFLNDTFQINADARGFLEFPRELPGFLTALFAGLLAFLPETRVAAIAALAVGGGMMGLAFGGSDWTSMLVYMTLWSCGGHLIMSVRSAIGMQLAHDSQRGRRLGQVQGAGIFATIIGCGIVYIAMRYSQAHHGKADYPLTFAIGGGASVLAAIVFMMMRLPGAHLTRPKFIFRRKYWLYYTLAFFFGARKQIFITFGPWVLVKIFNQPAYIFAQLWMASAIIGLIFQPALGRAVDRLGERKVLLFDSLMVFLVCAGYGFSYKIQNHTIALWLLYACYVGDQLFFGVEMARDTLMSKLAEKKEHIAPSLSLGITINHAVSMSIPSVGGLIWMAYGHQYVFMGAAGVAVLMAIFSNMIRVPRSRDM